jgi:hypothetical protein
VHPLAQGVLRAGRSRPHPMHVHVLAVWVPCLHMWCGVCASLRAYGWYTMPYHAMVPCQHKRVSEEKKRVCEDARLRKIHTCIVYRWTLQRWTLQRNTAITRIHNTHP